MAYSKRHQDTPYSPEIKRVQAGGGEDSNGNDVGLPIMNIDGKVVIKATDLSLKLGYNNEKPIERALNRNRSCFRDLGNRIALSTILKDHSTQP